MNNIVYTYVHRLHTHVYIELVPVCVCGVCASAFAKPRYIYSKCKYYTHARNSGAGGGPARHSGVPFTVIWSSSPSSCKPAPHTHAHGTHATAPSLEARECVLYSRARESWRRDGLKLIPRTHSERATKTRRARAVCKIYRYIMRCTLECMLYATFQRFSDACTLHGWTGDCASKVWSHFTQWNRKITFINHKILQFHNKLLITILTFSVLLQFLSA